MRTGKSGTIATVATAAAMAIAGTATADGGAHSRIVIKSLTQSGAAGKVTSQRRSCVANRKVSLFRYEGFVTEKLAITYTNPRGRWRVDGSLKPGRHFAKVDSMAGCRYDNSKAKQLG